MARYTGPRLRISRRFNSPVFGSSKYLERKAYPPGQHGQNRRRKATGYALALRGSEKKLWKVEGRGPNYFLMWKRRSLKSMFPSNAAFLIFLLLTSSFIVLSPLLFIYKIIAVMIDIDTS